MISLDSILLDEDLLLIELIEPMSSQLGVAAGRIKVRRFRSQRVRDCHFRHHHDWRIDYGHVWHATPSGYCHMIVAVLLYVQWQQFGSVRMFASVG
jgi:hypothetical protein